MNENFLSDGPHGVPWPTSDQRVRIPGESTLADAANTGAAGSDLLDQAVQGAHATIDRVADSAAPVVRRVDDGVSAAGEALRRKSARLRDVRDEWVDGMRTTVRGNPLACVAAALALGAVFARLTR